MNQNTTVGVLHITAGVFVRKQLRDQLERMKFLHQTISWHEAKGWIESDFTIRGPMSMLRSVENQITKWKAENAE